MYLVPVVLLQLLPKLSLSRLNNNQPTLGFINPLLYGKLIGKGFIDANIEGSSLVCEGFKATIGWDPASG